jgi:uncharacterized protein (DUF58 family)
LPLRVSDKATLTPSRGLLAGLAGLGLLGALAHWWPQLDDLWYGAMLALVLAALFDGWLGRQAPALRVERELAGVWPVDAWNTVTLTLHNEGGRTLTLDLFDDYPTAWQMQGLSHATSIGSGAFVAVGYRLCPNRRGEATFGAPHLRIRSALGLWRCLHRIGPVSAIKVFPDYSKLLGHTLAATERRTNTAGALRVRRRGEGTDFRQLREYRQGDSMRSIDWKATARYQKPITREYQEQRDQQVVFLLDTGRRMLAQDEHTTHFDHALDAVMTLGFLAQKQGDAVGLMTFGGEQRWLAPLKGRSGLDRLLAGVYDLQPVETSPDYTLAAAALLNRLSKRAFVVLITNLREEDDGALRAACELMSTKHLVMCASLREKSLDQIIARPVTGFADALRLGATSHYLHQRRATIRRIGIRADRLIDIAPDKLSMALVRRYRDIKDSGQL